MTVELGNPDRRTTSLWVRCRISATSRVGIFDGREGVYMSFENSDSLCSDLATSLKVARASSDGVTTSEALGGGLGEVDGTIDFLATTLTAPREAFLTFSAAGVRALVAALVAAFVRGPLAETGHRAVKSSMSMKTPAAAISVSARVRSETTTNLWPLQGEKKHKTGVSA
jgi:hypothetical protein